MLSEDEQRSIKELCQPYKSYLSCTQISEGIDLCLQNARTLYDDATLLIDASRHARGMSLLISCMEELDKVHVLQSMSRIPKSNQGLWAEAWANFRSHEHKATIAIVDSYSDEARAQPEVVLTAAMWQRVLAPAAERLRQYGLYVDFHSAAKRG